MLYLLALREIGWRVIHAFREMLPGDSPPSPCGAIHDSLLSFCRAFAAAAAVYQFLPHSAGAGDDHDKIAG